MEWFTVSIVSATPGGAASASLPSHEMSDEVSDDRADDRAELSSAVTGVPAVHALRRARRDRRLGDTEWYDVLYRAYLLALVGTIAVVVASDAVDGLIDDGVTTADLLGRGPSIAGVLAVVAFGVGLRNGADGGPVSVESGDVAHLLMAPVSRTRVMIRPILQRFRSVAFTAALVLGTLGQLAAREVEGSRAAWAASGALFGVLLAALYVGAAVVSHAMGIPGWSASSVFGVLLVWQCAAAWTTWTDGENEIVGDGPGDLAGSVAFWGIRQRGIDLLALGVGLLLIAGGSALGGRMRLDALERRGQLVSQLRFAATVQDIRTVVQLRRQLRAESARARPLFGGRRFDPRADRAPAPSAPPTRHAGAPHPAVVWRRGVVAIGRLPTPRWVRLATLAAIGGAAASISVSSTLLALVVVVAAVHLAGLESLEPLAQEVDRPDLTDAIPVERGWLFAHHLVAPAGLLAAVGLVAAVSATIVEPDHAAAAFALGVPLTWLGAIGAIVTTVTDAADPPAIADTTLLGAERGVESPFSVPEFAGFSQVARGALPIALSALAALAIWALSVDASPAVAGRIVVGVALCLAMTVWWVVRRDRWSSRIRAFFVAGRAAGSGAS